MAKKTSKGSSERPRPARRTEPVYTVMTFITFVAMAAGCALLYLDFEEYGKQSPTKETIPPLPKLGDAPAGGAATTSAPKAAPADGM
jgi:hypothetical protein